MQDPRLDGKPASNDGTLDVMVYDFRVMPQTAANILFAQRAQWPVILTYDGRWRDDGLQDSGVARAQRIGQKRADNLERVEVPHFGSFRLPTSADVWRDEYPFASTVENAGSTWVGHCDAEEQRAQARLINEFYRKHRALTYHALNARPFWFEVKVINAPQAMQA
jgi:hypothetical protein